MGKSEKGTLQISPEGSDTNVAREKSTHLLVVYFVYCEKGQYMKT